MDGVAKVILRRTPGRLRPGVELTLRVVDEIFVDRVAGLSAEIAFYFILSLPPLLLTVLGCLGYIGEWFGAAVAEGLHAQLMQGARAIFSSQTVEGVIGPMLRTLLENGRADVASFGVVFTLWSASRALNVVIEAITLAYDLHASRRAGWKRRAQALGLTVAAVALGLVLVPLFVAGPQLGTALTEPLGLADAFGTVWSVLYWPLAGVVATIVLALLYHYGAPWKTLFRRDIPGAVLAMVVWLLGSFGLRYYTAFAVESEDAVYRHFSAPLVILLWLYVSGFAILLGAELNAEIEKMWPTRRPGVGLEPEGPEGEGAS